MRLRVAQEAALAAASATAMAAVLLGGALPAAAWVAPGLPWLVWGLRVRKASLSQRAAGLLALAGLAVAAAQLVREGAGAVLPASTQALLVLAVARLASRRTAAHAVQALALSLLLICAATVLNQGASFAPMLLLYVAAAALALILGELVVALEAGPEGAATADRRDVVTAGLAAMAASVALGILLGGAALFLVFPRLGLPGLAMAGRPGPRLPPLVSLGGPPREGSTAVVARLRGIAPAEALRGLYLRGAVYARLTARGFEAEPPGARPSSPPARETDLVHYEIFLEPSDGVELPTLGPVRRATLLEGGMASATPRLLEGPGGTLHLPAPRRGPQRYEVSGWMAAAAQAVGTRPPAPPDPSAAALRPQLAVATEDLELPVGLDPRTIALARRLCPSASAGPLGDANGAGGASFATACASAIRHHLRAHYQYALDRPNAGAADPLAAFLFDVPRGHCEYFAAAFAVLLRAAGVPSRVIGGLAGGAWDAEANVLVFSAADAHVWVEWQDPQRGWLADDATPPRPAVPLRGLAALAERLQRLWDDHVIDYGFSQQLTLWTRLSGLLRPPPTAHAASTAASAGTSGTVAAAAMAAAVAIGGVTTWVWWRARPRRGHANALAAALERLHGAPLPQGWTLRTALLHVQGQARDASQRARLWTALADHEATAFAPAGHLPEQSRWALWAIGRGPSRARSSSRTRGER